MRAGCIFEAKRFHVLSAESFCASRASRRRRFARRRFSRFFSILSPSLGSLMPAASSARGHGPRYDFIATTCSSEKSDRFGNRASPASASSALFRRRSSFASFSVYLPPLMQSLPKNTKMRPHRQAANRQFAKRTRAAENIGMRRMTHEKMHTEKPAQTDGFSARSRPSCPKAAEYLLPNEYSDFT